MMTKELNWLLDYPNLKIYQYKEGFKFSLDSVLLAEYAIIKKSDKNIIDLCTGNAVIPIILNYKYHKKIYGIEIQQEVFDLARDSIVENQMENDIELICDNVLNIKNYFPGNNFDVVLCNPPYFKVHHDDYVNNNKIKGIARHEIEVNLKQIIETASFLLNSRGRFYMVHVPERIDEIFVYAYAFHMAVKNVIFVTSKEGKEPVLCLTTLMKDGKFGCRISPVICIGNLSSYQNLFHKDGELR